MRLRNVPESKGILDNSRYVVKNEEGNKGKWKQIFNNNNPIHIEIGTGKGRYIVESAKANPNINYIGIERYSSVLYKAVLKVEAEEINNLLFLHIEAEKIIDIFDKGEVSKILLNFSDPWPKDRHARRRLNSKEYLARYDKILKSDGCIEMKTDNVGLFDFGLEQAEESNWNIELKTYDLHNSDMNVGNIMTEYEEKFSSKGNAICKFIITR